MHPISRFLYCFFFPIFLNCLEKVFLPSSLHFFRGGIVRPLWAHQKKPREEFFVFPPSGLGGREEHDIQS